MKLVNVSYFGKGSQSSISQWSKPNESQLVLENNDFEFALHTALESEPWYQIHFPFAIRCYCIRIHNRRNKKYLERSNSIKVYTSIDGDSWELVYAAKKLFEFDDNALNIEIENGKVIKYIRIVNENNYVHLSQIEVLVNKRDNKDILLVSNRHDGLTQRILGMLETIAVARYCGFKFGFTWKVSNEKIHDILLAEKTFSKGFIEEHFSSNEELNGNSRAIVYGDIFNTPTAKKVIKEAVSYKDIYNKIEFSEEIQFAISKARDFKLPENLIAIHIRAGDIVYGKHRISQMFIDKVLQYPFVIDILNKYKNYEVLIVGEDVEYRKLLGENYPNVSLPESVYPEALNSIQRLFFDVELFSKCNKVFGGRSGPILLANKVSDVLVINLHEQLSIKEKLDVLRKHLLLSNLPVDKLVPPQHISYACSAYMYYGFNSEDIKNLISANNIAKEIESNTQMSLYDVLDLFLQYRFESSKFAEENVRDYITKNGSVNNLIKGLDRLYSKDFMPFTHTSNKVGYMEDLKVRIKQQKLPYANLLIGMSYFQTGNQEEANYHFKIFKEDVEVFEVPRVVSDFLELNVD
jgi:hypothetical protein